MEIKLMDFVTLGMYLLITGIAWGKTNGKLNGICTRLDKLEITQTHAQTTDICGQIHTAQTNLVNTMTIGMTQRLERIERLLDKLVEHALTRDEIALEKKSQGGT